MPDSQNGSHRWQRHEAKYLVTAAQAAEIRRLCAGRLPLDPYSSGARGLEYPVLSVYFDSPLRDLLQHTLMKQETRYKLRVRTYRNHDEPRDNLPAFFEIKRKSGGTVHKTRARLEPALAERLMWNERALLDDQAEADATTRMNISEFQGLRSRLHANPTIGTCYMREAYQAVSAERVRITIDRNLYAGLLAPPESGQGDLWWPTDPGGIILEVKFTNTYPFWVADMLRRLEVTRRGVCKYLICSRAAGVAVAR